EMFTRSKRGFYRFPFPLFLLLLFLLLFGFSCVLLGSWDTFGCLDGLVSSMLSSEDARPRVGESFGMGSSSRLPSSDDRIASTCAESAQPPIWRACSSGASSLNEITCVEPAGSGNKYS